MELDTFIEDMREAIELEDDVDLGADTVFADLAQWDSLAVLSTMAMLGANYDKVVTMEDIDSCDTVVSLFELAKTK